MTAGYSQFPAMDTFPVRRPPDPRIRPALEFIDAHPHRDIRLPELARLAGLSTARFSHLFTLATGVTPGKYLRRLRRPPVKSPPRDSKFS